MEIRTRRVDLDKVLEEIWTRYVADLSASCEVIGDVYDSCYEDARAAKYSFDTLRYAGLLTADECSEMQERVDNIMEQHLKIVCNRVTRNKED